MAGRSGAEVNHLKVESNSNDRNNGLKLLQSQRDSGYFSPVTPSATPGTTPDNAASKRTLQLDPQAQRSNSNPAVSDSIQPMSGKSLQRTMSSPCAVDSTATLEVSGRHYSLPAS